jgi:hypothetical protein
MRIDMEYMRVQLGLLEVLNEVFNQWTRLFVADFVSIRVLIVVFDILAVFHDKKVFFCESNAPRRDTNTDSPLYSAALPHE